MWGNGGRNIKLDKAKFTDVNPQSGGFIFSREAHQRNG